MKVVFRWVVAIELLIKLKTLLKYLLGVHSKITKKNKRGKDERIFKVFIITDTTREKANKVKNNISNINGYLVFGRENSPNAILIKNKGGNYFAYLSDT